jgi:hypothetical protein
MLMKICIAAAVALGFILAVPGGSFAQDNKDKSDTAATTKKPKKGHSDNVHQNAHAPKKAKKGRSDEVHQK